MKKIKDFLKFVQNFDQDGFVALNPNPVLLELEPESEDIQETTPGRRYATMLIDATPPPGFSREVQFSPEKEVLEVKNREGSLFTGMINVGRSSNNDIVLDFYAISKFQAYFTQGHDGKMNISDAESTNGTSVNGIPLVPNNPLPLSNGDNILFAGFLAFIFYEPTGFYQLLKKIEQNYSV
ncbi:FHA domain-containing protein [bacterium]|nr:FHA domain-containing protein [bacterium]